MKSRVVVIALLVLAVTLCAAPGAISYDQSWGSHGLSVKASENASIEINHSITMMSIDDVQINGETMQSITLPGVMLPNDEGMPNLPGTSRFIAIPQGAAPRLSIVNFRTEVYQNINLQPAPRIPLDTEDGPLEYARNQAVYSQDAYYPANIAQLGEPTVVRGLDVVMLGITPYQYNPVTRELVVYRDVEVRVDYAGGNGQFGENRLRNRWWDPILQDLVINPEVLPEINYSQQSSNADTPDYEYLIISPDDPDFLAWADTIRVFRTMQGIHTGVVTTTEIGGNNKTFIETYINNAYNTWDVPPVACLILGDYGTSGTTVDCPTWDNYCVSDQLYADVTGNDMADIVFARITARNAAELETMVHKFTNYELDPPTNPDFYNHPITALGWQTERWFQICSETVGGFWANELGKNQVRINAVYSGSPSTTWSTAQNTSTVLNYFGPNGLGYIPATPAELGGWNGGTAAQVNAAINDGAFMLQHRDHGGITGWGEPDYSNSNLSGLNNDDLTFVFSINCLTGKFNASQECFAEAFHRMDHGALGLIAASEVSYSFVNDTFVWGMYDNMWPEFMPDYGTTPDSRGILPAFANAAGKYFLQQSSWPYNTNNKAVTYYLFHMHGDAFSTVYSEVPQNLTITHDDALLSGTNQFTVTADAGSFIGLTVDGEIIGTAEGTGAPVNITIDPQLPGQNMVVTVTKQNYYRYQTAVQIIPPAGSYVIQDGYVLDDTAANGNGVLDYGETVLLNMSLKNVGVADATNVSATISTTDTYITINDDTEPFGTIPASSTVTVDGAFEITADGLIPDGHVATFVLTATDGTDTWQSSFAIDAHAPILEVGDIMIDDTAGGNSNGFLDPGETATITIGTLNTGTSDSPAATATLATTSPLLTINTTSVDLGVIGEGSSADAAFTVSVDASAQIGDVVDIAFNVVAGDYSASSAYDLSVGRFIEDFEDDNGGYTHSGSNDCWEWGIPTYGPANAYSGQKCWATSLSGDFPNSAQFNLQSIPVNLSANAFLSFYHWYDMGSSPWDGGNVKISADNGSTWNLVTPDGGYPTSELGSSNPLNPEPGYSGESSGWVEAYFDLSAYSGQNVIVKWDMGTTSVVPNPGWYIDDVEFGGAGGGPTTGTLAGTITLDGGSGNVTDVVITAGTQTTSPNASGDYSMALDPGTYTVSATLAGYDPASQTGVVIQEGQTTDVDLTLIASSTTTNPPENLVAEVNNYNDVTLTWDQPGGTGGLLAYHTGYDANGIGTGAAVDFSCAARFTAAELADFYGNAITNLRMVIHSADFSGVTVKVWEGGSFGDPGTEVYSQDVTSSVVVADWTDHTLTTPVTLVDGNEYWIGYAINATGDHPAAVDAGPMVADKGSWMYFNGAWDLLTNLGATLDFNWCIEGVVGPATAAANTPVATLKAAPTAPLRSSATLSAAHMSKHNNVAQLDNTRALTGYKVYRDGAMIHEITDPTITTYSDMGLDAGDYDYHVTAVYDDGESDPSNTESVTITLPAPANFNAVSQGPAQSTVMCTWAAPAATRNLSEYKIYRDGTELGTTSALFYADLNVPTGDYTYHVTAIYSDTYESVASNEVTVQHTDAPTPLVPTVTALSGNYPNPFNPSTDVKFSLKEAGDVQIDIFNIKGEKVKTLVNDHMEAAFHSVTWNGNDDQGRTVGSGIYFYKMRAGKYTSTKKMILMK